MYNYYQRAINHPNEAANDVPENKSTRKLVMSIKEKETRGIIQIPDSMLFTGNTFVSSFSRNMAMQPNAIHHPIESSNGECRTSSYRELKW